MKTQKILLRGLLGSEREGGNCSEAAADKPETLRSAPHMISKRTMTNFMKTERYAITFFGVDTDYYTDDYLLHLWEEAANQQYKNSKIYVTALIEVKTMVCGKTRGCNLENTAHVISTVRNPVESDDKDQFFACLKKIIMDVRSKLGNPCMSIMQETVDYYFFIQR